MVSTIFMSTLSRNEADKRNGRHLTTVPFLFNGEVYSPALQHYGIALKQDLQ